MKYSVSKLQQTVVRTKPPILAQDMSGTHVRGFAYRNPTNEDGESRQQTRYFHCDPGVHYNFFSYYDPDAGRFVNQEKIMLWIKQQDGVKDMMIYKEQDVESTRI